VHNRCDEPMFWIANITTYDEMMVFGKKEPNKFSFDKLGVPHSGWIDVKRDAGTWSGNCAMAECDAFKRLYEKLLNLGVSKDDIKVITPFTDVVKNTAGAGTIHTMQGKEAKIIVFILGGSSDGALTWASSKPNLLNVAVTRAKEYLFVIGDRDRWGALPYFSQMANLLPVIEI